MDLFEKMLKAMDKDGDGVVNKKEFDAAYVKTMTGATPKECDDEWVKIDKDKSGDISVQELAEYYGFVVGVGGVVSSKAADEDDEDDAILKALQMAASLEVAPAPEPPKAQVEKIARCKTINMKGGDSLEKELLEEAQMGDAKSVEKLIEKMAAESISVRVENGDGQMPLHLLAIAKAGDKNLDVVRKLLEAGGKARQDVNYQDNKYGKSPLHYAAENSQTALFKLLLDRGSDPTLTTKDGSTALHSAVFSTKLETVKTLLESDRVKSKKKELMDSIDGQSRTAMHIAAFRSEEPDMVKLLIDHGADPKAKDKAGNSAGALAGKSGRRKSRELLEAYT